MAFCVSCGSQVGDDSEFCLNCGAKLQVVGDTFNYQYSQRINSTEVLAYKNKSKRFAKIFFFVFAVGLLAFLLIYSTATKAMNIPTALLIYGVVMTVMILLSLFQVKQQNKTWDGVIIDKKIVETINRQDDGDSYYEETVRKPTLFINKLRGKTITLYLPNMELFNYFAVGEQVRKHKGFPYPEKLVKQYNIVHCINCGKLFNIQIDKCPGCKMPTIK